MYEDRNGTDIYYFYDSNGIISGIRYFDANGNMTMIYVVTNSQGDVIALYDKNGNAVVEYQYDAWGNIISVVNSTEGSNLDWNEVNPFRYRGYYYDSETGLYYLQSRYYDAEVGRFINSDVVVAGVGGNVNGYNLFAYCFNNPINCDDQSGNWPQWIKNVVKSVAKNVIRPAVKKIKSALAKVDLTHTSGKSVSISTGLWYFSGQMGVSVDTKGSVEVQGAFSGGVSTGSPGASLTRYKTTTNAPSVEKLRGSGYEVGGSFAKVAVAGVDVNIIPDSDENKTYFGLTKSIGMATDGVEVHAGWGETKKIDNFSFNVFDFAEELYIKIMEW